MSLFALVAIVLLPLPLVTAQAVPVDAPPGVLSRKEAEYTEEARLASVNATVLVSVTVGAGGLLQSLRLIRGAGFGLDESALATIRDWRFQPAIKGGVPVAAVANVEVSFGLLSPGQALWNTSLNFAVPPGGTRPQVLKGHVPAGVGGAGAQHIRVALTVGAEGFPTAVAILESPSPERSAQMLRELAGWQFSPGTINGQAWEMKGVMDLSTDGVLSAPLPAASRSRPLVSISSADAQDPSLPAPLLISPAEAAQFDIYPRTTTFRWQPVPTAASYVLEWDYSFNGVWSADAQRRPGAGFAVTGTEYTFDFTGAQPGRWRIWPVNRMGKRGTPSEWRTIRYTL